MKSKASVSIIGVLISLLIIASLVQATSIPVIVTPENLVLRDAYGNIVATSLTVALINNTNGYVQLARALTESGTTFPTVPAVGYLYYRTDLQSLYIWTGLQWVTCMTGTLPPGTISYNDLSNLPDLTVYLLKSGARPLTADWNTGAFGIYGLTYLNATAIWVTDLHATNVYANTVYLGNLLVDPVAPAKGQMWYNSAEDTMKYWNGTAIVIVPSIGGGSSSSYTLPYSYTIYNTGSTYYMEKYDGTTWTSINASAVANAAIGNLTGIGGDITFKGGTYPLGTSCLIFTLGNAPIRLFGEGNVIFTGSGLKMVDVTNAGYGSWMANSEFLTLDNMEFRHTTQSDSAITLDLIAAKANLKDVTVLNLNATRQGIGLQCGKGNASAPTGDPISWQNIFSYQYSIGIIIGSDHLTATNIQAYSCSNYGICIYDTWDRVASQPEWITLYSPEVVADVSVYTTIYPYYFHHIGKAIEIYGAKVEGGNVLTNPIFYWNTTDPYKPVQVFGFDAYPAGSTLANDYSRVIVDNPYGTSLNYPTSRAYHTDGCVNGTEIAHGLCDTPRSITLTMYGQNYINSTCWYLPPTLLSMNATHFIVCFTIFNAGTITAVVAPDSRSIYWIVAIAS